MKFKLTVIEKMIAISILFNMALLFARMIYTKEYTYGFYIWNTFLAIIPTIISRKVIQKKSLERTTYFQLFIWILFLPNAPYLITDIFHFEERFPIPLWYDLMIVISAAWNGIIICIVSILQIENFIRKISRYKWIASLFAPTCILLCGYGVFIGRFGRYNSWDIVTKPHKLIINFLVQVRHPFQHASVWAFTIIFACFLSIFFYTISIFNKKKERILIE